MYIYIYTIFFLIFKTKKKKKLHVLMNIKFIDL